jgi:hypothetical protein
MENLPRESTKITYPEQEKSTTNGHGLREACSIFTQRVSCLILIVIGKILVYRGASVGPFTVLDSSAGVAERLAWSCLPKTAETLDLQAAQLI